MEEESKTLKCLNAIVWRKLQLVEHLHDECPPVFSNFETQWYWLVEATDRAVLHPRRRLRQPPQQSRTCRIIST